MSSLEKLKIGDSVNVIVFGKEYEGKVTGVLKTGNIRVNYNGKSQLFRKDGLSYRRTEFGRISPKVSVYTSDK